MTAILSAIITTFFLVIVVFGTAIDASGPKCGGLFIGLTVALDILAIGTVTGAAMNPARALGPSLLAGMWQNHAIYCIGPIVGGILASLVYARWIRSNG